MNDRRSTSPEQTAAGRTRYAAAIVAALATTAAASAAPTPIPGGANQVKAVSGTVGRTIWNGAVRITISDVREATAEEAAKILPNPGQKVLTFTAVIRNGTTSPFIDLIEYTFADKDDVAVQVPTADYTHANLNILQGAAQKQVAFFPVDKDFVPAKILVVCTTCNAKSPFKPVRITIPQ